MKVNIPLLNDKSVPVVEPIAIVGMSCRFPQAPTLQAYWELLSQGRDTITEIPTDRWNAADYYDPDLTASRKTNQRHGSLLKNIHDFDPLFFTISPAEAVEMNPSQKLMLELVWEAIENSTIPYKKVQGRKAGVYVGNIWSDFEHYRKQKNAGVTSHSAVGQSSNIIANRVSFAYGLTGPSLVVDTGCSSSLVALHLACQSLWDNSTDMSFVAGINHILDPDQYILLSKFGGLSSTGRCSTFDIDADGFVRGEGAGVLMLKKLSQAEKDGDKIHAVIRGTAMNNNGYNVNLPATSVAGQKQVLTDAYANSGINPAEVHYVEAHGTGTKLGDPTETRALGEFFREGREENALHVGSVKTNIGHLEAAAGIAGLIKVVLAMQHKQLPPSLNFKTPNPNIPFEDLKVKVQNKLSAWPVLNGELFKAGINSFGWGGTNAHTVLEEYRNSAPERKNSFEGAEYCLPVSARSSAALKEYAKRYISILAEASENSFQEICMAAAILKPGLDHRTLFTAFTKDEMLGKLHDFIQEEEDVTPAKLLTRKDKVVMVFPGQGSQWLGMGKDLFEKEPVFRKTIQACEAAFKPYTDWSLIEQLHAVSETSRLTEINVIQPALCAMQIAITRLWMSWGIMPDAVVGHSMGEVAAAHISGALTLEDAARIICTRSGLMKTVSGTGGAMAVTELSLTKAEELVQRYPQLSVAVNNSPKSTVLAGNQYAITEVLAELEGQGLFARQVKVDVASHSQQMDLLKEPLHVALQGITPQATVTPLYSTVRNKRMAGEEMNADYWVDNLRGTVQFAAVMDQLLRDDHVVFIEVSPHPVLMNAVNECSEHLKKSVVTIASLFRDKNEQESIYKNLGELYVKGFDLNWESFYHTTLAPDVALPSYPFQRERYELEDKSNELEGRKSNARFPLLGNAIQLAGSDNTYFWETQISLGSFPYLQDHQVNETPVLPGATYVEMVLEAASEVFDKGIPVISHLRFIKSISLLADEVSTLQLKMNNVHEGIMAFQFFTKLTTPAGKATWELLADGELKIKPKLQHLSVAVAPNHLVTLTSGSVYYESLQSLGLQYGTYFQGIKEIGSHGSHPDEVHFTLAPDARIIKTSSKYKVHPALLDACLQPLFYTVLEGTRREQSRTTFLTEIQSVQHISDIDYTQSLRGVATLQPVRKDEQRGFMSVEANIEIYNAVGETVLKINGLKGKIIDTALIEERKEKLKNWLYKVNWVKADAMVMEKIPAPAGDWIIMGDPYGVSEILVDKMMANNVACIHVTPGTTFSKINEAQYSINYGSEADYASLMKALFTDRKGKISGILHAGSMSYTWQDPYLTADVVEEHQIYGSISFMYLHQQLEVLKLSESPQLVIITNGIQAIGDEHEIAQPVHSPLWGMTKVMFNELTQYNCRYFDLSANPLSEELDQVVSQITRERSSENEMAFRGNSHFVPRLGLHVEASHGLQQNKKFSSTGTYLVTGFRGLGFVFIEWMIRQGARNFALISRTGEAPTDVMERITVLESQGCKFKIWCADTGNYFELKKVLDTIERSMPDLKGVIHAAGVIEARTLTDLNQNEFLRILNPKVKGAWNLHLLTKEKMLDCFIMFSSASTLIGLSGQGSYVAANAFLDTLAHSRKRMGLPGMSINWGVMKDVGMVANEAELEKYAKAEGFEPVTMTDAMEVFNAIYHSEHTQIGIVKIHAESMANYYSSLAKTEYFNGLLVKEENGEQKEQNVLDALVTLDSIEEKIEALEQLVTQQVSKIVKTPASRIKSIMTFKGLGVDSLMAIQLRNLLEKSLHIKLSVATFWSHPSIHEYATFLSHTLAEQLLIKKMEVTAMPVKAEGTTNWFITPQPNPAATLRVFCFHDAGGNASLYQTWETMLGDSIELVSVELPGRGRRLEEKPYTDVHSLVADIKPLLLPLLDKPFVFFGHSMGGLIAFEIARELQSAGMPLPLKLFVSSTPGLTTYTRQEVDHTRSDEELINMFPHLDNANIGDLELQQLLINLLRSDLKLLNSYFYTEQSPLEIPVVALYGTEDDRVRKAQVEKWQQETRVGCKVIARPGGHRYIEHDASFLTALVQEEVSVPVVIVRR